MNESFCGFSPNTFKFLNALKRNNNRDWFNKNKDRYHRDVVEPMLNFIESMGPRLLTLSECFIADARAHGGSMFRIYRDTRFSKDKKPYKENIGCQFRHTAGKDAHAPGFYVHIEPKQVFFGGGIWMPPNPVLDKIRQAIVENPAQWQKISNNKSFQKRFGEIKGDSLKKPPRGYDANHPCITDLKRKSFFAMQSADPDIILNKKFITEIDKAFRVLVPLMEFICHALELPFNRNLRQ